MLKKVFKKKYKEIYLQIVFSLKKVLNDNLSNCNLWKLLKGVITIEGLWIGVILAALSIIGNVVVSIVNKTLDYKRSLKTTVMECAYKEWEKKVTIKNDEAIRNNTTIELVPFSDYVLFYSIYNRKLLRSKVRKKDIKNFFDEYNELYSEFDEYRNQK